MKRKAVSLVLCVAMILSAMTFSVSADAGEAKTLLKDDFSTYGTSISGSPWTKFDGTNNGQAISKIMGINVIDFAFRGSVKRILDTPIDLDSENVYYASWVQGVYEDMPDYQKTFKTGFVKMNSTNKGEDSSNRTILLWQGSDGFPDAKLAIGSSFSSKFNDNDNKYYIGTLYRVLMRIEAHQTGNDKISVKLWQADTLEPLNWTYEYEQAANGTRDQFMVLTGSVQAYFGDLNVEVYSGDKAIAADKLITDAKEYVSGTSTQAPTVEGNADVVADGVVLNSAKNILKLKDNTYFTDITITDMKDNYKVVPKIVEGGSYSIVVKIKNDSGELINNKTYLVALASYDSASNIKNVKLKILNSNAAAINGGVAKATGLTLENITPDEVNGSIRVYVWDAETLSPIINGITLKDNKIINY